MIISRRKKGFTLIELIIVIIIIGILASIAAPMIQGSKIKAICTQAVTTMAAIRTALRQYYVENDNQYPPLIGPIGILSDPMFATYLPGLDRNSLGETIYFGEICYWSEDNYIECRTSFDQSGPPGHSDLTDDGGPGSLYMDLATGRIDQINLSRSGYPHRNG